MLDVICTGIMDRWGYKFSRIWVATALVIGMNNNGIVRVS